MPHSAKAFIAVLLVGAAAVCVLVSRTGAADPDLVGLPGLAVQPGVVEQLGLTEKQLALLNQLVDASEHELVDLGRQWKTLPPAEYRERLAAFKRQVEAKGMALLSPQQQAHLRRIGAQRKGPTLLAETEVAERLQLTPEQRAKIAALLREEAGRLDSPDARTAQVARKETLAKISAILDQKQQAGFNGMLLSGVPGPAGAAAPGPATSVAVAADASPAGKAAAPAAVEPVTPAGGPPEGRGRRGGLGGPPGEGFGRGGAPEGFGRGGPPGGFVPGALPPGGGVFPFAKTETGKSPLPPEFRPARKPGILKFNFSGMPWRDVIVWFADQADLSVVAENFPPGSFTYLDNREYTPAQALDVLNSVLLFKGWTLLRRDRMLMVVDLESIKDKIPDNWVRPLASPNDLDNCGDYELVSVSFTLDKISPQEIEPEIRKLLTPPSQLVVNQATRRLEVIATGWTVKRIRDTLKLMVETVNQLYFYTFKHIDPQDGLDKLRQLLDIPADKTVLSDTQGVALRITLDVPGAKLIFAGRPDVVARAMDFLGKIDVADPSRPNAPPPGGPSTTEFYPVVGTDPTTAYNIIINMIPPPPTTGTPTVRVTSDPATGNIVVWGPPRIHEMVTSILSKLAKDARTFKVIPLHMDPQTALIAIKNFFPNAQTSSATSSSTSKTASTAAAASTSTLLVDVDMVNRRLILRGTQAQITAVEQFLELAFPGGTGENVVVQRNPLMFPGDPRTIRHLLDEIQQIWPTMSKTRIRVVTPSSPIQSRYPSGAPEGAAPGENEAAAASTPPLGMTPEELKLMIELLRNSNAAEPSARSNKPSTTRGAAKPGAGSPGAVKPAAPPALSPPAASPPAASPPTSGRSTEVPSRSSVRGPQVVLVAEEKAESGTQPAAPKAESKAVPQAESKATSKVAPKPAKTDSKPAPQSDSKPAPAAGAAPTSQDGSEITAVIGPGGAIFSATNPEDLERLERLLKELSAVTPASQAEVTIFYLKHAKASAAKQTLEEIYGISDSGGGSLLGAVAGGALNDATGGLSGTLFGLGGEGGGVRASGDFNIVADSRLNALIVQGKAADLDMMEQLLKIIDQPGTELEIKADPKPKVIPVFNTPAQEVCDVVRQVYSDRLVTGQGGGGRGGQAGPSPQELIGALMQMRGGRGGRGGRNRAQDEPIKMSVSVDTRTNSLIVAAPDALFLEVKSLVEELDSAAVDSHDIMQLVRLERTSPNTVRYALGSIMGQQMRSGSGMGGMGGGMMPGGMMAGGTPFGGGGMGGSPFGGGMMGAMGGGAFTPGAFGGGRGGGMGGVGLPGGMGGGGFGGRGGMGGGGFGGRGGGFGGGGMGGGGMGGMGGGGMGGGGFGGRGGGMGGGGGGGRRGGGGAG